MEEENMLPQAGSDSGRKMMMIATCVFCEQAFIFVCILYEYVCICVSLKSYPITVFLSVRVKLLRKYLCSVCLKPQLTNRRGTFNRTICHYRN